MKKMFLVLSVAIVTLAILAGCGHNTVVYGDGLGLETTLNPETFTFGLNFRYGKILTACVRENAEIEMTGTGTGNGTVGSGDTKSGSTSASSNGQVKVKIGAQITGYYVDALQAGATQKQLNDYIAPSASANTASAATDTTAAATATNIASAAASTAEASK